MSLGSLSDAYYYANQGGYSLAQQQMAASRQFSPYAHMLCAYMPSREDPLDICSPPLLRAIERLRQEIKDWHGDIFK